jgi:hypothetical protein
MYLPYGPFSSNDEFQEFYHNIIQTQKHVIWFAITVNEAGIESIRKTKAADAVTTWEAEIRECVLHGVIGGGGREYFAGTIAYLNADAMNFSCEIGHVSDPPTPGACPASMMRLTCQNFEATIKFTYIEHELTD